jgi:hypothetical protein
MTTQNAQINQANAYSTTALSCAVLGFANHSVKFNLLAQGLLF